ncbi:MAG: FxsA family protein [bacterium]
MLFRLILLFTIVPLVELALLIELGKHIGAMNTIAVVLFTGIAGAALARSQGFGILTRIRDELSQGQLPSDSLIDGIMVLAGALLLLTPGLLTDALGFALLVPFTRLLFKKYLKKYLRSKIQTGEIHVRYKVEE